MNFIHIYSIGTELAVRSSVSVWGRCAQPIDGVQEDAYLHGYKDVTQAYLKLEITSELYSYEELLI